MAPPSFYMHHTCTVAGFVHERMILPERNFGLNRMRGIAAAGEFAVVHRLALQDCRGRNRKVRRS